MNKYLFMKEVYELLQQKKIQMIIIFFIMIVLFACIVTKMSPEIFHIMIEDEINQFEFSNLGLIEDPDFDIYLGAYNKYMSQFGIAILLLAFNGNILMEFNNKTIYNLIALGISKAQILITKYITMIVTMIFVLVICSVTFISFLQLNVINIDFSMFKNTTLIILGKYMLIIIFIVFYSTIMKLEGYVGIFAISTYLIIVLLRYIPMVKFISPFYYISRTSDFFQILRYGMTILFWNLTIIMISLKLIRTKEI